MFLLSKELKKINDLDKNLRDADAYEEWIGAALKKCRSQVTQCLNEVNRLHEDEEVDHYR